MQNPVISIDHISKYFEIYDKPEDRLKQMLWRGRRNFYKPYWALRDVSFTVGRGDCVGIVGKNGAGKSTLLQIVTGTLRPTGGSVQVHGRVAALLELGSGFNPEFTGKENVFLNAAILGLSNKEISERYEDILAFADIGSFIDQPVKSYSSGMVVRLAFAVVAHVDADVLIVDEALSVGDAYFQQKCMRFMHRFIADHTVLFVSHDPAAVNTLCNRAVLLEQGRVKEIGDPGSVTTTYLKDLYRGADTASTPVSASEVTTAGPDVRGGDVGANMEILPFNDRSDAFGSGGASIIHACLLDSKDRPLSGAVCGEPVTLYVVIRAHKNIMSPIIGFYFRNSRGQHIFGDNTFLTYKENPLFLRVGQEAAVRFSFILPVVPAGEYSFAIAVAEGTQEEHVQLDWKHNALVVRVTDSSCTEGLMQVPMQHIEVSICA